MAKEPLLAELGDMLTHVVAHMATKEDFAELRTELKTDLADLKNELTETRTELRGKLDGINRRLDTDAVQRTDQNVPGRIEAIKKHLGLTRTIAG